ncbi:MAG: methyltransferase domain-containing protein [Caldilineales bacterium]
MDQLFTPSRPAPTNGAHPFDAAAGSYDAEFTGTQLARWLRETVWSVLGETFAPGDRVLELGCGTGEDAVWLAQRGVHVTATDASTAMLDAAQRKAAAVGISDLIDFAAFDLASSRSLITDH